MTVLVADGMIDCTGADPYVGRVAVEVQNSHIVGVERSSDTDRSDAIDLGGLMLLPGLIDAHSHLAVVSWQPHQGYSPAMLAAEMFDNAERCLMSGHTTVRETGGADGGLVGVIEAGMLAGPRVLPSGRAICQTAGHGDMRPAWVHDHCNVGGPGLGQLSIVADGVTRVRLAARENFRAGATQLKVCLSGGILSHYDKLTDTQYSLEELSAAVDEARSRGTYVTAHAVNSASIELGLDAGLSCFEHCFFLEPDTAERIAREGASVVFTLGVIDRLAKHGAEWGISADRIAQVAEVADANIRSLAVAKEAGLRIGSGTDLIGPKQEARGGEIGLKSAVLGALGAIESATRVNAEILGLADEIGTVEVGKVADLIAVDGNPAEDPYILEDPDNIVFVMQGGRVRKDLR